MNNRVITMPNTWKAIEPEQLEVAQPCVCKYCGKPIYFEKLPNEKKRPVDAIDLKSHDCRNRYGDNNANANT